MKLEGIKFPNIENYLKGIINSYRKKVEENSKLIKGYKEKLEKDMEDKAPFLSSRILHNVKNHDNFNHIINSLFNNNKIKEFYTDDTLRKLICSTIAKKIKEKKSINLNDEDIKNISCQIKDEIINLKEQKYIFQVLHLKYEGKDIAYGACTLTTFDESKKVYATALHKFLPGPNPAYKNFIIVKIFGNDSKIYYPKALNLAKNFVNVIKLWNQKSPLLRLHDTYFVPFKDGLTPAYHNSEVLHWDLELKEIGKLGDFLKNFQSLFDINNEKYQSVISALNRFSYALTIPIPSFQLSEISGCLETLLTRRREDQQTNIGIDEMLTRRICSLFKEADYEKVKEIIKDYYDERSDYTHQSQQKDIEKKANTIAWIFTNVILEFSKRLEKFDSKNKLLSDLDSDDPKTQITRQKSKKIFTKIIWYVLFTLIISQIFTGLSGWTIVDPILSRFGLYKVAIEPNLYPQVHDGKTWILTEIRNDGLRTINNLNAEYYLKCEMDSYEKAILQKTTLKKGDSDTFEFQADLDTNCSIGTIPYELKFFKDKNTDLCYMNTSGDLTSEVCMWCEFNVTVYDGFEEIDKLHYFYPFSPGGLTMGMEIGKGCQDINKAPNPQNLIYEPGKDIRITIFDFCPGCIRGEITDKEWCKEYCSEVYK